MKEYFAKIWFWMAVTGSILASLFANAAEVTHEKITFLNFSDNPLEIFWVDPNDENRRVPFVVAPYEAHDQNTFSGHIFMYRWKEAETWIEIRSESEMVAEFDNNGDTSDIVPQTHVLGGMDQSETKKVICGTTKGDIHINVKPFWSPRGAARFLDLVNRHRYFNGCSLNRVVPGFLTQFGIGAVYEQRTAFRNAQIPDDPQLDPPIHFRPGTMSYAGSGKNSRTTEMFVVMPDTPQSQLEYFGRENSWETPFAYVEPTDLHVVGNWYAYGDMPPWGKGPDPQKIYAADGYEYLSNDFPEMDYILGCAIVPEADLQNPMITGMTYEELAAYVFEEDEEEL